MYLFEHNYFTVRKTLHSLGIPISVLQSTQFLADPTGKLVVPLCSEIFSGQTYTPIDWKFHCASFAV